MKRIFLIAILASVIFGQGTWLWSGRVHSELKWHTIETENFRVHYHNGIEEIAIRGASMAEQVLPTLMKQMGLEEVPMIDIIFTTEDEIMNGYAMWTNQTFIWVDQNDAAIWLENGKWLFQVLSHELQHIMFFNVTKSWVPEPWGSLFSGTPGWFVEGLAEYETEKWRPYRADLSHKYHIFKNTTDKMDAHHDGYSKLLYFSERFGDSSIVNLVQWRNKFGMYNFEKAFKKATNGVTVKRFEEDWRQQMNTYFYGYRSQKEAMDEIGNVTSIPASKMQSFAISPDSLTIAMVGKMDSKQWDSSLIIAEIDTSKKAEKDNKKPKRKKYGKKREVDFGRFGEMLSFAPCGNFLTYAKYHFGENGSMIWDIKMLNLETGKSEWLTKSMRANHPNWSNDGTKIVFVAHQNGIGNLFTYSLEMDEIEQMTNFADDVQILSPKWSPNDKNIAFALAGADGNTDIAMLDFESGKIQNLTDNDAVDYLPIWNPNGSEIIFTSHKGSTPNLHSVNLQTLEQRQITDVGEAVFGVQWTPNGSTILATTLANVDSTRIVQIDPTRQITTGDLAIREHFSKWRTIEPEHLLETANPAAPVEILNTEKYKFWKYPQHFMSLVMPDNYGISGFTVWSDALGKHLLQAFGWTPWNFENGGFLLGYINAQHGPLWGFNYFENTRYDWRFYDGSASGLLERLDGWDFYTSVPYNFGNSMSSSHNLRFALTFQHREPFDIKDWNSGTEKDTIHIFSEYFPAPEEGKETVFSIGYNWLNRRPHSSNARLPKNGFGVDLNYDFVIGDFKYQRIESNGFFNLPLGKKYAFYSRLKTKTLLGTPPAQEFAGITNEHSIYANGFGEAILGNQENHNLRGSDEIRIGEQMIFGSSEIRFPLLKKVPINILGISTGSMTGAIFSDYGNAFDLDETPEDWIVTFGVETKTEIKLGGGTIFQWAIGTANTLDGWKNYDGDLSIYGRFALVNPF